jgi:hypothetical protein
MSLIQNGWLYDVGQNLAGAPRSRERRRNLAEDAAVAHPLDDAGWGRLLQEIRIAPRESGKFVMLDLLRSRRWTARALWSIDRVSYPTAAARFHDPAGHEAVMEF